MSGDDAVRRSASCACGGGCPRCAAAPVLFATPGPTVQRAPANGGSWLPEPQDEPTSTVPEAPTDPTSYLPEAPGGDGGTEPGDVFEEAEHYKGPISEKIARALLRRLANAPVGPPSGFTGPQGCPETFCQPFVHTGRARRGRAWTKPLLLEGIRLSVDPRVVPLWKTYIEGGAAPDDKSTAFAAGFAAEAATTQATRFLHRALEQDVLDHRDELLRGSGPVTVDFTPRLATEVEAINTAGGAHEMLFTNPRTLAGNLAGAIGTDQVAHPIGARPSPFNDARKATVKATLEAAPGGGVLVTPTIEFTVCDTLDLCPGHCGGVSEQIATVPLSRFEASGISGDVPFWVTFAPPAKLLAPFVVSPSPDSAPPP